MQFYDYSGPGLDHYIYTYTVPNTLLSSNSTNELNVDNTAQVMKYLVIIALSCCEYDKKANIKNGSIFNGYFRSLFFY